MQVNSDVTKGKCISSPSFQSRGHVTNVVAEAFEYARILISYLPTRLGKETLCPHLCVLVFGEDKIAKKTSRNFTSFDI